MNFHNRKNPRIINDILTPQQQAEFASALLTSRKRVKNMNFKSALYAIEWNLKYSIKGIPEFNKKLLQKYKEMLAIRLDEV